MSEGVCAYEACRCPKPYDKHVQAAGVRYVDPNAEFCSARCEETAKMPAKAGGCECGHVKCTPPSDALM